MELLKNLEGLSADEQMTAVVELQKAAMKHLEEQKQASIGKSAELVIQGLKKIKSDFEAKFDSLNYDIQTKVASLKDGEQGLQGPKGDHGERGLDGANGRDGRDGKDGKDGVDGVDGVGVKDAKIDFDGSLVISLTDGREINCGEVVSVDVAKQIQKVTHNIQTGSGGDSQTVLDAIAAIQATIATYGTMATQNANNVAITGGAINNTTIGATTPSTGVFTTLTGNSTSQFGRSSANYIQAVGGATTVAPILSSQGSDTDVPLTIQTQGSGNLLLSSATGGGMASFAASSSTAAHYWSFQQSNSSTGTARLGVTGTGTNGSIAIVAKGAGSLQFSTANTTGNLQLAVTNTTSAVNYVQVTGAVTSGTPTISAQGSDTNPGLNIQGKGFGAINFLGGTGGILFQINGTNAGSRNYLRAESSATTFVPILSAQGTDTNIPIAFQSKGTGAIDLAAGSSGVNISNGGTVTALTVTAAGSAYTSIPTPAITVPTTAGGVQATASATMSRATSTIVSGGTGYTLNDTITVSGGTFTTAASFTVSGVTGGVVNALTVVNGGTYSVLPTGTLSTTGGTGTGLTLTIDTWSVRGLTITNAGSGYVEQPTVTFSGGGGSGAAAYATVGSGTTVKTLGSTLSFSTPSSEVLRILDNNPSAQNYLQLESSGSGSIFRTAGASANPSFGFVNKGTGSFYFSTSNSTGTVQLNVAHTASAVNYVQVTGAATSGLPVISAQGSDTNIAMYVTSKGNGTIRFATNNSAQTQLRVSHTTSAVNFVDVTGSASGAAPIISVAGNDTNIDLALTPKGTGVVQFGSYTASALLAVAGYITIKDSGGTTRRLLVG